MQRFWEVAPPMTWGMLTIASVLLMVGFVLLSHTLVRAKAYGDSYSGLLGRGRFEWTLRLGVASLLGGSAFSAYELGSPPAITGLLAVLAAAAVGLQAVAALRHR